VGHQGWVILGVTVGNLLMAQIQLLYMVQQHCPPVAVMARLVELQAVEIQTQTGITGLTPRVAMRQLVLAVEREGQVLQITVAVPAQVEQLVLGAVLEVKMPLEVQVPMFSRI
jgi:hypothetical protein